jgi:hypothetical protein
MNLAFPVFLSLDSLLASFVLGSFGLEPARRSRLVVAFGLCDAVASLIGATLAPAHLALDWAASRDLQAILGIYLVAAFLLIAFHSASRCRLPFLWTIPLVLSLDNLAVPAASTVSAAGILWTALASSSTSLLGFSLAAVLLRFVDRWPIRNNSIPKVTP